MNQIDSVWSSDDEEADDSYREWNASESLKGDGWSHGCEYASSFLTSLVDLLNCNCSTPVMGN